MAASTTVFSALNCVIELDDAGGTLRDISGSSNKVEMEVENKIGEYEVFGEKWTGRLVTRKDGSFKIDFYASTTANEAYRLIRDWFFGGADTPRTLRVKAPNGSAGSDIFYGEVLLGKWSFPLDSSENDPVMGSAEFLPHLGIFLGTV